MKVYLVCKGPHWEYVPVSIFSTIKKASEFMEYASNLENTKYSLSIHEIELNKWNE
jgi:hypothetical protein